MITIALTQKTRDEMNTSTPRAGDWTYHHVLPVRYYFTIAYVSAYAAVNNPPDKRISNLARKVLGGMVNNTKQVSQMMALGGHGLDGQTKAAKALEHAKLCASPLFGGFAGMNPEQRCDDPKDGPEQVPPISSDEGWWAALQLLKLHVEAVFPKISAASGKDLDLTIDEQGLEWFIESVERHVSPLSAQRTVSKPKSKPVVEIDYPILPFDPNDWKLCPTGDRNSAAAWAIPKKGASSGAWDKSAEFDSLLRAKPDAFNDLWGTGLKAKLNGTFALRRLPTDPEGAYRDYDGTLKTAAQAKSQNVFRQIGDRLVRYIPD